MGQKQKKKIKKNEIIWFALGLGKFLSVYWLGLK